MKKELILNLTTGEIYNNHNFAERVNAIGYDCEEKIINFINNINFEKERAFVEFSIPEFEKEFVFEISDDNGSIIGKEIFIPKKNEVWEVPGNNYNMAIQCVRNHNGWDADGLELQEIEMTDENGEKATVQAYIYELEPNDITIFDIINFVNDYASVNC